MVMEILNKVYGANKRKLEGYLVKDNDKVYLTTKVENTPKSLVKKRCRELSDLIKIEQALDDKLHTFYKELGLSYRESKIEYNRGFKLNINGISLSLFVLDSNGEMAVEYIGQERVLKAFRKNFPKIYEHGFKVKSYADNPFNVNVQIYNKKALTLQKL